MFRIDRFPLTQAVERERANDHIVLTGVAQQKRFECGEQGNEQANSLRRAKAFKHRIDLLIELDILTGPDERLRPWTRMIQGNFQQRQFPG